MTGAGQSRAAAQAPPSASAIARRWTGVLPQQAPMMVAPADRISSAQPAIMAGSAM